MECDRKQLLNLFQSEVSIHALLVECDRRKYGGDVFIRSFNPRTPCGVRLDMCKWHVPWPMFQSTHSLWSATELDVMDAELEQVSIHALLVECDLFSRMAAVFPLGFNPRTPCGVRRDGNQLFPVIVRFQSTHSLWSATVATAICHIWLPFQSTHSLWSATNILLGFYDDIQFQSTHSLWSATGILNGSLFGQDVSIHALLVECDRRALHSSVLAKGFNPRTPCGVRRKSNKNKLWT